MGSAAGCAGRTKSAFLVKAILDSARQDALSPPCAGSCGKNFRLSLPQPVRQPEEAIPPEMLGFLNTSHG